MLSETGPGLDKDLISTKLSRLRLYLRFLKELQKASVEEFMGDFKACGAAERYLQVSIECLIDVGSEIISSLQLRRPERYRDVPYILAEAKIIPKEYAETFASMIGFRNLLVHDYASINLKLVYEFLQTKLSDIEEFIKHIANWLKGR
ncbi:MAG: type VII toxin-antitoxin system HepT family RNase toxin [Candidatus Bathyarchaeia archaeon]